MNTNPESDLDLVTEEIELPKPSLVAEVLLAIAGLLLTIFCTFVQVFATNPPWQWWKAGIYSHPLGTTYQVGAVLLTACVGGSRAGAIAQLGYITLGLAWLPIFAHGGGWDYWQQPTFGYLLGFIPGAWLCGWLAYRSPTKIESLALSCLAGLGVIHGAGMVYLVLMALLKLGNPPILPLSALPQALITFSLMALPGQIILVCLTAVLAYFLRRILFY
ncbi:MULTISPECIES: biotin transporter BioY [unclassified Synechocystis]|uniref:biotin transporter BioY n=1 Tax=unclassified Synechocystis TaxID=2640012 RepID=UPI000407BFDF|nr:MULTISPECIES: biotin transporter BioY [unclassified Synechocystis]AIE73088.1 Substrate-specific component BioY of biotin ECF transporter [Synechocystis sp. PCC 6714]MCT0254384.1 biotin transporter BioY [Synechocystis sp. CS-94]